jgi:hypothetical protein
MQYSPSQRVYGTALVAAKAGGPYSFAESIAGAGRMQQVCTGMRDIQHRKMLIATRRTPGYDESNFQSTANKSDQTN